MTNGESLKASMANGNGYWNSKDPRLRNLRTVSAITVLALLAWTIVTGKIDLTTIGTLAGMLLVILGFEAGVSWPGGRAGVLGQIDSKDKDKDTEDPPEPPPTKGEVKPKEERGKDNGLE